MAESETLLRALLLLFGIFIISNADENTFRTITISSDLIKKFKNDDYLNVFNVESEIENITTKRMNKSLHFQKRRVQNSENIDTKASFKT